MCIKNNINFLITLSIILLKFYEFSIVSSATHLLGMDWAMPVKGLLVKFVGPHQRTGQSPLSQKRSGGEIHRAPKAGPGGIISAACYWGKAVSPEIFFF